MPESHKAERSRARKQNRMAGIGDESGRIVRVKDPVKMAKCKMCTLEVRMTKTNTELRSHAVSKHSSTFELCFPEAKLAEDQLADEAATAAKDKKKGGSDKKKGNKEDLSSLLAAGLAASKPKKK
mmetsp:Transcript_19229/g.28384  ORF Transcript_19229/g.28384 Transcript_19229/m.28384 type:complete len:125 (-) Transcript_19229:113-487(-)|eukprot:CAMPEP_0171453036 /NCGR_PEP_ID=MMETSP0945-20130129/905_1 /TAXON_ID=109269 /ORGANISM="Vaucheria litorea, Strain CCMP2940" /LENGTH=124 /DNA_ID=CAMNT_0011977823 /DNA_START=248 /DNA_END=622 /DNA_ORIENTATION=-